MELDLNTEIEMAQEICHTSISKKVRSLMPYSLAILQKHYKLQNIKIVVILKTLTYQEYIVAQASGQFFFTRDGKFWSPLPVLSGDDFEKLSVRYGMNSTEPFIGDPGVVLVDGLTELHRLSQLTYFLQDHALYPAKAVQQQQRFQGIDAVKACDIASYQHHNGQVPQYSNYEFHCCPQKQLITISYKYLPQFKSYYYLGTRIYGFVYGDTDYAHTNGLLQVDFYLFRGACPEISQEWLDRLDLFDRQTGYEDAADATVLANRQAKADRLEERKAAVRRQIREYKEERARKLKEKKEREEREERERLEKERLAREKAEEKEEAEEAEEKEKGEEADE